MNQVHDRPMAGRTVVVTGATAGIGKATAVGLAAMGAHVAITGRDRGRTEAAACAIGDASGGQVDMFVADLTSQEEVRRLADELARRLKSTSVTANALHPGVVSTSFGAEDPGVTQRVLVPFMRPFMKTPAQGAATTIHVASARDLEQVSGRFFANSKPKKSSKRSYDKATAAQLWQVSADLVGLPAAGHFR